MSYEDAKLLAEVDFKKAQELKLLEIETKNRVNNFKGEDLGFISRDDVSKFGLNEEDGLKVSERIFGSKESEGYILLNDKSLLFKISDQRLPKEGDMENLEFINQNLLNIKDNLVNSKILDILKSRYKIKLYYKNDKGN
jgi:peptidyl-prolyl cis-trans isomerase D